MRLELFKPLSRRAFITSALPPFEVCVRSATIFSPLVLVSSGHAIAPSLIPFKGH